MFEMLKEENLRLKVALEMTQGGKQVEGSGTSGSATSWSEVSNVHVAGLVPPPPPPAGSSPINAPARSARITLHLRRDRKSLRHHFRLPPIPGWMTEQVPEASVFAPVGQASVCAPVGQASVCASVGKGNSSVGQVSASVGWHDQGFPMSLPLSRVQGNPGHPIGSDPPDLTAYEITEEKPVKVGTTQGANATKSTGKCESEAFLGD